MYGAYIEPCGFSNTTGALEHRITSWELYEQRVANLKNITHNTALTLNYHKIDPNEIYSKMVNF